MESWHQDYRPENLQLDAEIKWLGLDIVDYASQGGQATVEFEALLLVDKQVEAMHEKSQFVFEQGRWFYTTGEMMQPVTKSFKPGRNSSCPCGSGLKFKRCCAK